jgi:hypothetical protein
VTHDGTQEAQEPGEHSLPPVPAMPVVSRSQLDRGRRHLLVGYGLRFLGDRLMVCPQGSATAVAELPYDDLETVDVSGSCAGLDPGATRQARVLAGGRRAFARGIRAAQG